LHGFSHSVHDSFLVVVNQHVFFLRLRLGSPFFGSPQLSDQIESFFLAFKHHVLLGPTSEQTLQKDDRLLFLVIFKELLLLNFAV